MKKLGLIFDWSLRFFTGCGNGKYLSFNPYVCKIGLDRCSNLANAARDRGHEVLPSVEWFMIHYN